MKLFWCVALALLPIISLAESIDTVEVESIVIGQSSKETNTHGRVPSAMSTVGSARIAARDIVSIKQVSAFVPNLFVPDYGSPLSTPVYIRGVGTRGSGQSVGVYVDDVPVMDKSAFDIPMYDIERVEVLRGPQGTLYGRNAMGGVINIYTPSPLNYQGTTLNVGAQSYNNYEVSGSHYMKLGRNVGLALGAYYNSSGGYFRNAFDNQTVDKRQNAGGKLKLEFALNPIWRMVISSAYDWTNGGGFAYGAYNKATKEVSQVDFNDEASYFRETSNSALKFERRGAKVLFTSNTSYQYLRDNMVMDQDFTPRKIFTINQRQLENAISQELTWRSNDKGNYQWSIGAYGFFKSLNTVGDVKFGADGVKEVLQPVLPPFIKITDSEIPNPGTYNTPAWGAAIYHQSTFNNLITKGLSLTLGLRLDYEKQYIDYRSSLAMNMSVQPPGMPRPIAMKADTTMSGNRSQDFFKVLPRLSLSYECSPTISTWFTASKGYRAGGYNVQMFSEVLQGALQSKFNPNAKPTDLNSMISYKPEVTWNYEIGTRGTFGHGILSAELVLFYMDITNVQLTQFVAGGSGRILSNAGHGRSMGVEISTTIRPISGLAFDVNYGYTEARFVDYNDGKTSYNGKYIPYTPRHTFSVAGMYNLNLKGFIDNVRVSANYTGAGKIFWNEANDISQPFYGLLNAKASIAHGPVRLEIWGRNILGTDYNAFYFESFSRSYMQQGAPMTFGGNILITL